MSFGDGTRWAEDEGTAAMVRRFIPVSELEILGHLSIPPPDQCPPLTLIVGPCRSGTTALLRAAASTGHRSYFQPVKRIIRQALVGRARDFVLEIAIERIVIKETFGPFLLAEVMFDPLRLLMARGYPVELIHLVVVLRDPREMYLSWERLYSANPEFTRADADVYVAAFRHTVACYKAARDAGIGVTAFVPDGFSSLDEGAALAALFQRCGLTFGLEAVAWRSGTVERPFDSLFERDTEPEAFRVPGALNGVRGSDGYRLIRRGSRIQKNNTVPPEVIGLYGEYEKFRSRCRVALGD